MYIFYPSSNIFKAWDAMRRKNMVRKRILRRGLLWPWHLTKKIGSSKSLHTSHQQAVFGKAQVRLGPREKHLDLELALRSHPLHLVSLRNVGLRGKKIRSKNCILIDFFILYKQYWSKFYTKWNTYINVK